MTNTPTPETRRQFLRAAGRAALGITCVSAAAIAAAHHTALGASKTLTFGDIPTLGLLNLPSLNLDSYLPDVYHITQFWGVETAHRDFLRGALKLDGIIPHLGIRPKMYQFGVETMSREQILALLIDVEATGTAAYLGAIPYFRTKIFLTTAAGIQGTEARHTAALQAIQNRLVLDNLISGGAPTPPAPLASDNHGIDTPMDPDAVLAKVSPFIVN